MSRCIRYRHFAIKIEGVTESVQSTETAMRELQQITGIVDQMQEPPAILEADLRRVAQ